MNARPVAAWLAVLAWGGLIFALSAQANLTFLPDEGFDLVVRKIGHMAVFGVLALLLWWAAAETMSVSRPWAWAAVLATLYAITDELHQATVTGRHASALDVGIDAVGALLAVAIVRLIAGRRRVVPRL